MKKYVPDFFAYYILYPQSFKDRNMLLEDKRLFSVICNGYNVPHPRVFFTTCKGIFYDKCNDVHLIDSVVKQINDLSIDKLFIKPTYGVGGKGIFAFHRKDNCFVSHKNNIQLNKDFLNGISNSDYIIQEGLFQHKILNEIYPHSINTFRIFTQCIDEKEISTLFAILRIGQGSMEIDNASSGGMYVKINLETGILDKKALSITGKEYLKHPDSNFVFDGFPIPFWPEIKLLAEKTALKFKEVKYLGWDIALTENGPVIIEANNAPDISLLQDCYSGIKDVLNIDKPQSYWYSSKFNLKDG